MSSLIVEVCSIDNIEKHPNADRLSIATVKGWNCIVGLDQYKIGDMVVFVPPDSVVPDALAEKYKLEYLRGNGRVRTVKLRGYISQGLILDVPDGNYKIGDDVAGVLGITKYEPPEIPVLKGARVVSKKRTNPDFKKYTDIENINNFNGVFQDGDIVVITEKIHGTNARYGKLPIVIHPSQPFWYKVKAWFNINILRKKYEFVYGSHNVQLGVNYSGDKTPVEAGNVWAIIAKRYELDRIIPEGYIVYGEIYGNGIQDLTYGLDGYDFVIFDVMKDGAYLDYDDMVYFCSWRNLNVVPVLITDVPYSNDIVDKYTNGKSKLCPSQIREGCVIKPTHEENHPRIGRKILKSVSKDYLTRQNGTEYS